MSASSLRSRFELPPAVLGPFLAAVAWAGVLVATLPWQPWADGFVMTSNALLAVALVTSGFAALHDDVRMRRINAVGLLGWFGALLVGRLGGLEIAVDAWSDLRYVWLLLVVAAIAGVGLAMRRRWARWLGLGLGFAGAASAGLNAVQQWLVYPGFRLWLLGTFATASVLLIVNLAGTSMARADRVDADDFWQRKTPVVFWLRAAIVSSFVAVPMLLVYAWVQPSRLDVLVTPAVCLAAWLAASTVLTVRGRVLGAMGLVSGGFALLVLIGMLLEGSPSTFDRGIAYYYVVFWGPAAVCAIVSGARLAQPLWRVLRRDA